MLGALFPPNGRYAPFVALILSPDLFICAKDLFMRGQTGRESVLCSNT